jgi:nickel transport protein
MNRLQKSLVTLVMGVCLLGGPTCLYAASPAQDPCQVSLAQFQEQNNKLSGDLRRIQRELAALRADLAKPGLKDILAGIGYILGLFGTAAFVASRRKE